VIYQNQYIDKRTNKLEIAYFVTEKLPLDFSTATIFPVPRIEGDDVQSFESRCVFILSQSSAECPSDM
jgi:hypothetical protein